MFDPKEATLKDKVVYYLGLRKNSTYINNHMSEANIRNSF